jgi:hypothetical protein
MLDYSYKTLNIYDDKNYTHYGANHPKIAGVAYLDKHRQPSDDSQAGQVLTSVIYVLNLEYVRILGNVKFVESFRIHPSDW